VALFNAFHIVLLMDSTYKTNMYNMPLFYMVGVKSIDKIFNVAFGFLANENEDKFTWVLQECWCLLRSEYMRLKVIVTDRNVALLNVIDQVFLDAAALVCRT
jgi:hypothetical protein